MPFDTGVRRTIGKRRKRTEDEPIKRGMMYCIECGFAFKGYFERRQVCDDCRSKLNGATVVYDRESGIGTIPLNLQLQYGLK
jgi:hypothetical protein